MIPPIIAGALIALAAHSVAPPPEPKPVAVTRGTASWVAPKWGRDYLAMRLPKGTHVRICAVTCWDAVVVDYGPAKRTGRIADIAVERWEAIVGKPRSRGLATVTVEVR